MSFIKDFENRMQRTFESQNHAYALSALPFNLNKLLKLCVKQIKATSFKDAGDTVAPNLYTVMVSAKVFSLIGRFYEDVCQLLESFAIDYALKENLVFDQSPCARFIIDPKLKGEKFYIVVEHVEKPEFETIKAEEQSYIHGTAFDLEKYYAQACSLYTHSNKSASNYDNTHDEFDYEHPDEQDYALNYDALIQDEHKQPVLVHDESVLVADALPQAISYAAPVTLEESIMASPTDHPDILYPEIQPASYSDPFVMQASEDYEVEPLAQQSMPQENLHSGAYLQDLDTSKRYMLAQPITTLGRDPQKVMIALHDTNISRAHCRLEYRNNYWLIEDLNSTNGTMVNGHRITSQKLEQGDHITLGVINLVFREN